MSKITCPEVSAPNASRVRRATMVPFRPRSSWRSRDLVSGIHQPHQHHHVRALKLTAQCTAGRVDCVDVEIEPARIRQNAVDRVHHQAVSIGRRKGDLRVGSEPAPEGWSKRVKGMESLPLPPRPPGFCEYAPALQSRESRIESLAMKSMVPEVTLPEASRSRCSQTVATPLPWHPQSAWFRWSLATRLDREYFQRFARAAPRQT